MDFQKLTNLEFLYDRLLLRLKPALHNFTKSLSKILTLLLCMISNSHIKNCGYQQKKMNDINMEKKKFSRSWLDIITL